MSDLITPFISLPAYGMAALIVLLLYAIQSEVRFGKRARTMRAGLADRWSTAAVSISAAIPVIGLDFVMKSSSTTLALYLHRYYTGVCLHDMSAIAAIRV